MNSIYATLLFVSISLLLTSCYEDPDFSDPPRLTDISVYTKTVSQSFDSLVVRVGFEDGDGDLGIIGNENEEFRRIPNPNTGEPYWIYNGENPDMGLPPYDCERYRYIPLTPGDTIFDTLLIEYNEAYYNFSISLFTKGDGQYQEVDLFGEPNCGIPLGGRFFPLRDNFEVDNPLKGVLQWGTIGPYSLRYRNDTLRLDVVMRDRAGNVSNVVSTEDFTLNSVRRLTEEE